jgi:hypothetical protein
VHDFFLGFERYDFAYQASEAFANPNWSHAWAFVEGHETARIEGSQ